MMNCDLRSLNYIERDAKSKPASHIWIYVAFMVSAQKQSITIL